MEMRVQMEMQMGMQMTLKMSMTLQMTKKKQVRSGWLRHPVFPSPSSGSLVEHEDKDKSKTEKTIGVKKRKG
jgi:hypothetical protein